MLHPDHQEVHLTQLGLHRRVSSAGRSRLATHATINYAHGAVALQNFRLPSGDQQIAAAGTFGRPGDSLKVTLDQRRSRGVDALLLRPPQLTGRSTRRRR